MIVENKTQNEPISIFFSFINVIKVGLAFLGKLVADCFCMIGEFTTFSLAFIPCIFTAKFYWRRFFGELAEAMSGTMPLVFGIGAMTGSVLALQCIVGFDNAQSEYACPMIVVKTMSKELGPVMTGLIVSARIGAGYAATLGSMKVSDQIDAMRTLGIKPYVFLIAPRIPAGLIATPIMSFVSVVAGTVGGFLTCVYLLNLSAPDYIVRTVKNIDLYDIMSGEIKAAAFGLIIAAVGCYLGQRVSGGAREVGRATTNAVVIASWLVICVDCFLTYILK